MKLARAVVFSAVFGLVGLGAVLFFGEPGDLLVCPQPFWPGHSFGVCCSWVCRFCAAGCEFSCWRGRSATGCGYRVR